MHNILKKMLLIGFASLTLIATGQEVPPYWQNLKILSVNKEKPRTGFMSYSNKESAIGNKYENSRYYKLLNGKWKFYFTKDHRTAPANVTDAGINTANWKDIVVPGNWEVQGFGIPVYVNYRYEFNTDQPDPPHLPLANEMGVYRRNIEIPSDWLNRDIYFHIGAAKSGVYLYVNGKEVGYSEDSKNPAEFLINKYLKKGENEIAIKIFRWSTSSYLECQDFWRLSGLERDVFIWSQPKLGVDDFNIISTLDDNYKDGIFKMQVNVKNTENKKQKVNVKYELVDANEKIVASGNQETLIKSGDISIVEFKKNLQNVKTWTSETPNLYCLYITIAKGENIQEVVPFNVGFRRIEIKESEFEINGHKQSLFYVNGQPIKLKGVNIHEVSLYTGHYVTPQQMIRNFELMKSNNVNSVRLSHYPQDDKFYEMCDKFGFYVYNEANVESHGMGYDLQKGGTLGNDPDWLANHLYRTENMFERTKNYPSVTIWSLGNEAGNGYNFYQTYLYLKSKEDSLMKRPVCYERALWEWNTDMFVPQYLSAESLVKLGENGTDRPVVMSEYAHAMGNSTGDFNGQWNAIYKYPHLQGGYIWEWIEHALLKQDKDGVKYWAYGGDYGTNMPSDGNFVADGMLAPDQTPHPGMTEVKYNMQNIGFEAIDLSEGKVKITNRFYFTDLSGYQIKYRILEKGIQIKEGILPLNILPQQSDIVTIPIDGIQKSVNEEYFINFEVTTKKPEALVPAGYIVAYDQFEIPSITSDKPKYKDSGEKLVIKNTNNNIDVSSTKLHFVFDKKKGLATSYKVNGFEYFNDEFGIQPNFWRGPTDNDYGNGAPKRVHIWKEASRKFEVESTKIIEETDKVKLLIAYKLPTQDLYEITYNIYPDGVINIKVRFVPEEIENIEMPRIGIRFRIPKQFDNITYFGRGPEENYCDRKKGTLVGLYQSKAEDMYYPYTRPQENGHHTDTRWVKATDTSGKGILILADSLIEFNTLCNAVEDFDDESYKDTPYQWSNFSAKEISDRKEADAENVLRRQTHINDVKPRNFVEVCIDYKQQGVGGYDSWGARPITNATIYPNKVYYWGFTLAPVLSEQEALKMSSFKF